MLQTIYCFVGTHTFREASGTRKLMLSTNFREKDVVGFVIIFPSVFFSCCGIVCCSRIKQREEKDRASAGLKAHIPMYIVDLNGA